MTLLHEPRILVVTPTLGTSPLLDVTVSSVLMQKAPILHVIAAPATKVAELGRRYPHARVVLDAGRLGGIYGALNAAIAATPHGWEWFTYINDDDLVLPGMTEMLAQHMRAGRLERVLYGDVELIDESGKPLTRITTEHWPEWIPALLQQGISPIMQQGMLFRREVVQQLGGFDMRYRLCADLDFWLRAYVSGAGFLHYRNRVGQFRLRAGQLSGATEITEREQADIVSRHLPVPTTPLRQHVARFRYRVFNLPRYVTRMRARGIRTSYELLQEEAVRR